MKTSTLFQEKAVIKIIRTALSCTLLLSFLFAFTRLQAQDWPLNRRVSLDIRNKPLEEVLFTLSRTANFNISYNARILAGDSLVSLSAHDIMVKDALGQLLDERYEFKAIGNHLIIQKRIVLLPEAPKPQKWILKGYIVHAINHSPIAEATIYEDSRGRTALTGEDGSFSLQIPWTEKGVALSVTRIGYRDTVVVLRPEQELLVTLGLVPVNEVELIPAQTVASVSSGPRVEDMRFVGLIVPARQRRLSENIMLALRKIPIQFSLLPSVSTNGGLNGGMDNILSVNLLAGYSNGVRGVEVGGLVNVNRQDMYGVQAAGLGNVVGGRVRGAQGGGLFNVVEGNFVGAQGSGFINIVGASMNGVQGAGFMNIVDGNMSLAQAAGFMNIVGGDLNGVQGSGFMNITGGRVRGVQGTGFMNIAGGNTVGVQVAGFGNISETLNGIQVGGFMNIDGEKSHGIQVAGAVNVSGGAPNLQVAGLVNVAQKVQGLQVGLINVADTMQGLAIGLLNISRNGLVKAEISGNEYLHTMIRLKSGSRALYYILGFGTSRPWGAAQEGYLAGLGSNATFGRFFWENELTATQMAWVNGHFINDLNMVTSFTSTVGYRISGPFEIFAGPSFNMLLAGQTAMQTPITQPLPTVMDEISGSVIRSGWIGFKAGVQMNLNGAWQNGGKKRNKEVEAPKEFIQHPADEPEEEGDL
ncbi:MAG: hypothetical protein H6581_10225 [Bacteroidia bacterium]|nr:hypothetical protein [Bacteroidia bacterium]